MFCSKCRSQIPDGSRYCPFCGGAQKNPSTTRSSGSKVWIVIVIALLSFFIGRVAEREFGKAAASPEEKKESAIVQKQTQESEEQEDYSGYIPSSWAAEKRSLRNGGTCSIMLMDEVVRNCTAVNVIIEAEGNYGATTKGNWEIHFRIDGQWKHVQTVYYGGFGKESFYIQLQAPTTFDAVSAFPVQRGNYSYTSWYALSNPVFG